MFFFSLVTGKALKEELIALRSSNSNLRDRERHLRMEIVELKEREHEVHSELSRVRDHLRTSQGKEKVIEMELEREREEREKLWHRCRCQAATMLERQLRRRQTVPSDLVEARHRWTPRVEHRRTSSADAMRVSGTPKSRKGEKSAASTSSSHEKVDTAEVPVVDDVETTPMQLFVELLKKHYINALVLLMKYRKWKKRVTTRLLSCAMRLVLLAVSPFLLFSPSLPSLSCRLLSFPHYLLLCICVLLLSSCGSFVSFSSVHYMCTVKLTCNSS